MTSEDLALMAKMIDTCTERGAFRGAELSTIGSLRERIIAEYSEDQNSIPNTNESLMEDNTTS